MLTDAEQTYICQSVSGNIPFILDNINFDHTVKEVGHSFHGTFEDALVQSLCQLPNFSAPTQTRSLDDIRYKDNLINIKFGYNKSGNSNIGSFNKIFNALHNDELDSYYLLLVNITGNRKPYSHNIYFFDILEYLDYVNYDYGTGQMMLTEKSFLRDFGKTIPVNAPKRDKMIRLGGISRDAFRKHMRLKEAQENKRLSILGLYMDEILEEKNATRTTSDITGDA
jgi:hypothetical protein